MRILVIEDDRKVARFLAQGLREEQYAVDLSRNGEEALHLARTYDYDVIILDIMLPKKDGFTVCRELRQQGIFTPILMLTAKDALEDKIQGLSEGADDYLTKPFSFEELLARIKALMRRSQEYKTVSLQVADLILDPYRRLVKRGGKRIDLTGKEFALLEYLLRNKGRIVSPTMILEHVWERDYYGGSNIVNVYINHLRQKINHGFTKKLIKTIRGQGFTIEED
ncbi:MAG TPA: response regulator transcription factor [Candidatus Aminicenantes bacterium]|nr:response regulator transcription factor [Candidatus Aminicenantes bacterium]